MNNVITYFRCTGQNTISKYSFSRSFPDAFRNLSLGGVSGLPLFNLSLLIIDLSLSSWSTASPTLSISPPSASLYDIIDGGLWGYYEEDIVPSSLAVSYRNLIKVKGVSVSLPGIIQPGTSGDGVGFPPGFGDWFRS
ncbi:MAG: hypothetical protein EOM23_10080 [Candidatus Moranbacteria bacterium]|nr:hypothetical protein [Candidatus Moranbacteria bacterium]